MGFSRRAGDQLEASGVVVLRDSHGERLTGDRKASGFIQQRYDDSAVGQDIGARFRFRGYGNGVEWGMARVRQLVERTDGEVRTETGLHNRRRGTSWRSGPEAMAQGTAQPQGKGRHAPDRLGARRHGCGSLPKRGARVPRRPVPGAPVCLCPSMTRRSTRRRWRKAASDRTSMPTRLLPPDPNWAGGLKQVRRSFGNGAR